MELEDQVTLSGPMATALHLSMLIIKSRNCQIEFETIGQNQHQVKPYCTYSYSLAIACNLISQTRYFRRISSFKKSHSSLESFAREKEGENWLPQQQRWIAFKYLYSLLITSTPLHIALSPSSKSLQSLLVSLLSLHLQFIHFLWFVYTVRSSFCFPSLQIYTNPLLPSTRQTMEFRGFRLEMPRWPKMEFVFTHNPATEGISILSRLVLLTVQMHHPLSV